MHPMFYPFMLPTLFMLKMVSPYSLSSGPPYPATEDDRSEGPGSGAYSLSSGPPHPVVWDTFASDLE